MEKQKMLSLAIGGLLALGLAGTASAADKPKVGNGKMFRHRQGRHE